jgi:tetratricopeptide (TPR) repeat protein
VRAEAAQLLERGDPGNPDSVFKAVAGAVRNDLEAEALPLARAGVANHPNDPRMWQVLGLAYRKLDDLGPAAEAFAGASALAPNDALIAHSLARANLEAGLPAADLFERAHQLAPLDASVLLGRAAAQFAEGRIGDAIAGLDAQLRVHPGWLDGHASAARLRWLDGQGKAFTQSYTNALSIAPRELDIWRAFIDTLMRADFYEDALAAIARGRTAAGTSPYFDALEAVCAAEKGDAEAADRLFAKLMPIGHVTMAARYMRHLLRSRRFDQALAFGDEWQKRDPDRLLTPYLATVWRIIGDPRWDWLEGDERLVGVYDLADRLPSLDALAERLRTLHLGTHQPLDQSVRGGTQTDGPLFSRIEPEIRALRQAIVEAVEAHIAQLPPPDPTHPTLSVPRTGRVRFSGSWSVRLVGGGQHANHIHPEGWFSSAFYVALPAEEQRGAAPAGWLKLGEPQAELGLDLPPFRHVEPKPGRLVLFPSTMWHGTLPFGEGERLTVAFDVARPKTA